MGIAFLPHFGRPVEFQPRHVEANVRAALETFRVVQIVGARQVGKTTLARRIGGTERVFVSMDERATREQAEADPAGFLDGFGQQPLLIDEVQRVPELYLAIKRIVDEEPRLGRYLLTGSAEPTTSRRILDSLAGRIGTVELRPMSQGEIAGVHERFLERLVSSGQIDSERWLSSRERGLATHQERMFTGGFPAAIALGTDARRLWLRAYREGIFARDVRELARIDDLQRLEALFRLIASHSGQLLKPSSLARDAHLAANTARSWVGLLAETRTVDIIAPWAGGQRGRLVNTPKGFVLDSGLLANTLGMSAERLLRDPVQAGCLLETFVLQELLRQRTWLGADAPAILHFRDRDQHEVDVVIERVDGGIVGVEVKAASTVRGDDARGIGALARRVGNSFAGGVVVYCGEHPLPLGPGVTAVPLANIWA